MSDKLFSHLNPILFLQTFVAQSIEVSAKIGGDKKNDRLNHIERLGLTASGCFEAAYRHECGKDGPLDHDKYADMIVEIKNKIGGNFSRASSEPGMVRVVNTRCGARLDRLAESIAASTTKWRSRHDQSRDARPSS